MSIQLAGGTYVDSSVTLTGSNVADIVAKVRTSVATAGWTVTDLGTYNLFGVIPPLFNQSNVANNNTVTIVARVYTWKTTLTGAADEILIGAAIIDSLTNFKAAINAEAGAGTLYGTGTTINADVSVPAIIYGNGSSGNPTALVYSKAGTAVTVTESSNFAWYNTTTTAKTLYKLVSVETPAFQQLTEYIAEDVNSTADTLFFAGVNRAGVLGVFRNVSTAMVTGNTVRCLAHRYGFHLFKTGVFGTNGTGFFGQSPYIPTFLAPKKITGATNATPIVITTSADHGYQTGDTVVVKYVEGNLAANGSWSITVTSATSFSLNSSIGTGTFSGSLGLAANQSPPRIETMEQHLFSFGSTSTQCFLSGMTFYGNGVTSFGGIFDGTPIAGSATASFLLPEPVNTSANRFIWVSGEGVALEPLVIYTTLYGASVRCGGQLYNAWVSSLDTTGGSTNTADGHTYYGIFNNDSEGQLFLLTS